MTDLTQVYEDFKNSKVVLDDEFWEEQNMKMGGVSDEDIKLWKRKERIKKILSYDK